MSGVPRKLPEALEPLIGSMSVLELQEFVAAFEKKFGTAAVVQRSAEGERQQAKLRGELAGLLNDLLLRAETAWKDPVGGRAVRCYTLVLSTSSPVAVSEFAQCLSTVARLWRRSAEYYFERPAGLQIREIRRGSIEILLELLDWHTAAAAGLFLASVKTLAALGRTGTESIKNLAEAYKVYQEGSEIRERRARTHEEEGARLRAARQLNRIAAEVSRTLEDSPDPPLLRAVVHDVLGPESMHPDFPEAARFMADHGGIFELTATSPAAPPAARLLDTSPERQG